VAAAGLLSGFGIAFLEVRGPGFDGTFGKAERTPIAPLMRSAFAGPLVLNSDYRGDTAQLALDSGEADAISFGRTFLASPDLPRRIADGVSLNSDDQPTWYSQGESGYVDYPVYSE